MRQQGGVPETQRCLKLPPSSRVGALVPQKNSEILLCCALWRNQDSAPRFHSFLTPLLFCVPSLSWLAAVWICPLELRESPGGWKKPISYKKETNEEREGREVNTETIFTWEVPTGSCFISGSGSQKKDPSIRLNSSWNRSFSRSNTELSLFSWCSLQWQKLRICFWFTLPLNWKTLTQAVPLSFSCQELDVAEGRECNSWKLGPLPFSSLGASLGSSAGKKKSASNAGDPGSIPGLGRSPGEGLGYPLQSSRASLVAQTVKNLTAVRETWVQFLGWEEPLEECMATHSSILAWRIPMERGVWWATVHGAAESDMTGWLSTHTQVLLPLLCKERMKLSRNPSCPPLGKVLTQHILHWQQERTAHQGSVSNHTAGKQSVSFSKVVPCQWVYFYRSKTTAGNFCSLC